MRTKKNDVRIRLVDLRRRNDYIFKEWETPAIIRLFWTLGENARVLKLKRFNLKKSLSINKMYTNPFERKHSVLRQALDKLFKGDARLSFRKKSNISKRVSSSSSMSSSSSNESVLKLSGKRWISWTVQCLCLYSPWPTHWKGWYLFLSIELLVFCNLILPLSFSFKSSNI